MIAATLALAAGFTTAAEVVLGPGDVVKASVYGSPDLAIETRVSEGGSMTFPLLGEVQVGGLTTQQAEKKIGGLLEKGGYL
jgi:polysaccharide export outer membrane protein